MSKINYTWPDVTPEYIYFSSQKNTKNMNWKFFLMELVPSELFPQIHKHKINTQDELYLNLEIYEHLRTNGILPSVLNIEKEGTYALGMMILKLGLRKDIQDIYDLKEQLPSKIIFSKLLIIVDSDFLISLYKIILVNYIGEKSEIRNQEKKQNYNFPTTIEIFKRQEDNLKKRNPHAKVQFEEK